MRPRRRQTDDQAQTSEALADIALNSFGLILIVLLAYILTFHQATSELMAMQEATTPEGVARQLKENQELKKDVQELKKQLASANHQDEAAGLWRFRIHVTKLIDSRGQTTPTDFVVDYFVWLKIQGTTVSGTMFGVKEHRDDPLGSQSHADITGSYRDGFLTANLAFSESRSAESRAVEVLRVKRQGDKWVGELTSGSLPPGSGYRNYGGKTVGTRLKESVFSK